MAQQQPARAQVQSHALQCVPKDENWWHPHICPGNTVRTGKCTGGHILHSVTRGSRCPRSRPCTWNTHRGSAPRHTRRTSIYPEPVPHRNPLQGTALTDMPHGSTESQSRTAEGSHVQSRS
eukprot:CAMPEP_0174386970 /NCGR_PEP_ID=MMETSP0811_2-20130205/127649_1 /TAXON_ID=73025 ORGANISM="Eutreptiella gymnastica-like, Strain CCMP1594" /NCGR_SAMPLE_ID=MMETSP0811_2 /ASSEMBLY_ACC=CAM_ASM_000667 /LENGTH=120 /DNA_ID=CAMNT_0015541851 /DNA_START=60 /DNA_END=422 /DNA_ORIENTATION=-